MYLYRSITIALLAVLLAVSGCGDDELRKKSSTDNRSNVSGVNNAANNSNNLDNNANNTGEANNNVGGLNNLNNENNANNGGTTNQNNANNGGANNQNNANNGGTNNQNNANNDVQCTQALEECTPGEPTNSRFRCENMGQGSRCYTSCTASVGDEENPCSSGEACLVDICVPSECEGYLDEAGCQGIVDANPSSFPHGVLCAGGPSDTFFCVPAADAEIGDFCSAPNHCPEGAICANDECMPMCTSESDCTRSDRDSCNGLSDADFLGVGLGVCFESPEGS